jgi:hypothetical protein
MIIIDAVAKIDLPDDFGLFHNTVQRLLSQALGLQSIYRQVKQIESIHAELHEGWRVVELVGSRSLSPPDLSLLECMFHWYSVSACNYVNLIAWIGEEINFFQTPQAKESYRREVCGPVKTYRDKVSAHYAITNPSKNDSHADLLYSTFNCPTLMDGRLRTGGINLTVTTGGVASKTTHDTYWSVTEFHESLELRYGPKLQFTRPDGTGHSGDTAHQDPQ